MVIRKGDILRLSQVGLTHIYKHNEAKKTMASMWRFEYRCKSRNVPDCLSVKKIPQGYYRSYHESFLEKVAG